MKKKNEDCMVDGYLVGLCLKPGEGWWFSTKDTKVWSHGNDGEPTGCPSLDESEDGEIRILWLEECRKDDLQATKDRLRLRAAKWLKFASLAIENNITV